MRSAHRQGIGEKKMKKIIIIAGLIAFSSAAWAAGDSVQSLRGAHNLDSASIAVSAKSWSDGEGKVTRQYAQQPPLVPHDIEDFSINLQGNDCLSCHNWDSTMEGATKVGMSHFLNRNNEALAKISPRRYFCTQCHVPQKNTKPLVLNSFKSLSEE